MSSTYRHDYTRYTKRGRTTEPMTITVMSAMTAAAYDALVAAPWTAVTEQTSDLPPHKWTQSGFLDTYDAAKYCGDYAASKQHAYACAVAYTIKIPADALTGEACVVERIAATLNGDRWLSAGAVLSAHLSQSPTPPNWDDVLAGGNAHTPDPPAAPDAVSDYAAPLKQLVRSNAGADTSTDAVLELNAAPAAYLHVVLRLADYLGTYGSWIEGAALVVGTTLAMTYSREVVPDTGTDRLVAPLDIPIDADGMYAFTKLPNFTTQLNNVVVFADDNWYATSSEEVKVDPTYAEKMLSGAAYWRSVLKYQYLDQAYYDAVLGMPKGGVVQRWESTIVPPMIGTRYGTTFKIGTYNHKRNVISGVVFARSLAAPASGSVVTGIGFDTALPTLPRGITVRMAAYAITSPIVGRFTAVHPASLWMRTLWDGAASAMDVVFLDNGWVNGGPISGENAWGATHNLKRALTTPSTATVAVQCVATHDFLGGQSLPAGEYVDFTAPYMLGGYAMFLVCMMPVDFADDYPGDKRTDTAVAFAPNDIYLKRQ